MTVGSGGVTSSPRVNGPNVVQYMLEYCTQALVAWLQRNEVPRRPAGAKGVIARRRHEVAADGRRDLRLPATLREQGSATAGIGKWHLGWDWPAPGADGKRDFTKPIPDGPTTRGFDLYFGTDVPNYPPYCFIENDRTVGIPSEAAPAARPGCRRLRIGRVAGVSRLDRVRLEGSCEPDRSNKIGDMGEGRIVGKSCGRSPAPVCARVPFRCRGLPVPGAKGKRDMHKADVFERRIITFPPHPVRGQPGLYRVWFMANWMGSENQFGQPVGLAEAMLLVDATGEGAVIDHQQLDPPLVELEPRDFELRALELVRAMRG